MVRDGTHVTMHRPAVAREAGTIDVRVGGPVKKKKNRVITDLP